jgi:hypothetical protein
VHTIRITDASGQILSGAPMAEGSMIAAPGSQCFKQLFCDMWNQSPGPCVINITFLVWTQQELSRFSPPKPSAYLNPRAFLRSLSVIGSELTRERPEQNYK